MHATIHNKTKNKVNKTVPRHIRFMYEEDETIILSLIECGFFSLETSTLVLGASLTAQWQRTHLPTQEDWVRSLGREAPLRKEMATHSSTLDWEIPRTEDWQAIVHRVTKQLDTT